MVSSLILLRYSLSSTKVDDSIIGYFLNYLLSAVLNPCSFLKVISLEPYLSTSLGTSPMNNGTLSYLILFI